MTNKEKYLITLIRSSENPSAAIEKVNQILSSGQSLASEALHPVTQKEHS